MSARYGERSRRRQQHDERDDERHRRGGSGEEPWTEGRGYRLGREDYGSGSWEGEGEAYGGSNRRFQNNLSDEAYGNERYNYPQGFRSNERDQGSYSRQPREYDGSMGRQDTSGRYNSGGGYGTAYGGQGYGERSNYAGFGYGERSDYAGQGRSSSGDYDRGDDRSWWNKFTDWLGMEDDDRRRRAAGQRGEHRGRGPKGYRRSDERIKDDVNDRLSDDHFLDASDIDVNVEDSVVILTGHVSDRWDKRRAESIAESVSGVSNVENRLRVGSASTNSASTSASTTKTDRSNAAGT
jgi:osmotically-inducible protein OsmY